MPQYYFHIHDHEAMLDPEYLELADDAAARVEAIRCSGEMIRDAHQSLTSGAEWRMEVTNAAHAPVFTLRFSTTAHRG